jgi:hypothetical protein
MLSDEAKQHNGTKVLASRISYGPGGIVGASETDGGAGEPGENIGKNPTTDRPAGW